MAGEKIRVDILGALDLEKYKLVASDSSLINTLEDGHIITKAEGRATVTAINKENNEIKGQVNIIIEGKPIDGYAHVETIKIIAQFRTGAVIFLCCLFHCWSQSYNQDQRKS